MGLSTFRLALVALAFVAGTLSGACGSDHPPPAGNLDAGRRIDSGPVDGGREDAAGDAATGRPVRPTLPPADLEVTLPYLDPEVVLPLSVNVSDVASLDVHFSIDTTGSFFDEIDALQAGLDERIVPELADRIRDVAFGVSRFEDFPESPFGATGDSPFRLVTPVTTDLDRVRSAVASLDMPIGNGGDQPEAGAEALWQIATGDGYSLGGHAYVQPYSAPGAPASATAGGVGFREGSLRIVVHVTDATTHVPADYNVAFPSTHDLGEAASALERIDAHVIGIASGSVPRAELEGLAIATGAVAPAVGAGCPTGIGGASNPPISGICPLVFDIDSDGTGLSDAIVDAIVDFLDTIAYREVYGVTRDDRLGFVRAIEAVRATAAAGTPAPTRADARPPDGIEDTFVDVRAGATLDFALHLQNVAVTPADYDQVFRVGVELRGDDLVLLRRTIRITVPRGRLARPDAGASALDAASPMDADAPSTDAGGPDADADAGGPDA